jgi:propanol-preferring alcohol dehydrogenase
VIGVDLDPVKLELAKTLGVEHVVRFEPNDSFVRSVKREAGENPISVILETVSIQATVEADLKLLGSAGRLIVTGYTNLPVTIPPYALVLNELSFFGSRASSREDVRAVLSLLEKGTIVPVISKTYPLEQVNYAMEELRLGKCIGRQVITIG